MGEEDSAITFESLYDVVRKEKTSEELQKLNPEVYSQLINYLKTKKEIYRTAQANNDKPSEIEKIKEQLISAIKLIKELYERRERKILQMAMQKSRTNSEVDVTAMLRDELPMLNDATVILGKYRKNILMNLVNGRLPNSETRTAEIKEHAPDTAVIEKKNMMIRFINPVPKFLGTNMEVLGPFVEGDIANLPKEISELLIKRERAEEIKS